MKSKYLFRAVSLLVLLISFFPARISDALAQTNLPPPDMFQWPWEQGVSWVALDTFDNGTKRLPDSPHNYLNGGAVDFAPRKDMKVGEDTSKFWVTAAAAGTVVAMSSCSLVINHGSGWITEYQFLANFQVKLGDTVNRNQRLAVIADGLRQKFCPPALEPDIPHVHFSLRPQMRGATFSGWVINYNAALNKTTFTKDGVTVGQYQPLSNVPATPVPTPSGTSSVPTATPPGPTVTPPSGPYVSTTVGATNIQIGETTPALANLNNVPVEGYTSAEFTCTYNPSLVEVSNITVADLFGADPAAAINGPQNGTFIVAIAGSNGSKATTNGAALRFNVKGLQSGQTAIECKARVSQGNNTLTSLPSIGTNLNVLGGTPTPTLTPSPAPITPTIQPSDTPTPTFTATPTSTVSNWLTYTNLKYGFQFNYPPQGVLVAGNTDNFARINLPFVQGTNLHEKYLQVDVTQNANPCRSPVAASSITNSSSTVTINGISFLKEVGGDAGAGNFWQFVAYSTSRDNVCVSLSLVLHSLNPGNSTPTEIPFDYAAEIAVVDQIAATYTWLALPPTATPTPTTSTSTPVASPTSTTLPGNGTLTGQVIAGKTVTVGLYNANNTLISSVTANADGTFSLSAPAGNYTAVAVASGFLGARGTVTLSAGSTSTKPSITLLAGDIDNNSVIDQLDALTIGMNYNASTPAAADLNNDGTINVLDLELLARNYRKTGPLVW